MPKGVYPRTEANKPKPRKFPSEIVAAVRRMYLEEGMTVREVQDALPKGYKAQRIIERHIPERRPAAVRDQRGPRNPMWKHDPGYQAAHLRVASIKGPARDRRCIDCDAPADDWSYVHGCDDERQRQGESPYCIHSDHYEPRCRPCHRAYDRKEVVPHV